jgi:hypothetical protein
MKLPEHGLAGTQRSAWSGLSRQCIEHPRGDQGERVTAARSKGIPLGSTRSGQLGSMLAFLMLSNRICEGNRSVCAGECERSRACTSISVNICTCRVAAVSPGGTEARGTTQSASPIHARPIVPLMFGGWRSWRRVMGTRARQRTSEWISGRPGEHKSESETTGEKATVCARYDRRSKGRG